MIRCILANEWKSSSELGAYNYYCCRRRQYVVLCWLMPLVRVTIHFSQLAKFSLIGMDENALYAKCVRHQTKYRNDHNGLVGLWRSDDRPMLWGFIYICAEVCLSFPCIWAIILLRIWAGGWVSGVFCWKSYDVKLTF